MKYVLLFATGTFLFFGFLFFIFKKPKIEPLPKNDTLHILYITPYSVILKDNNNKTYVITDSASLEMIYFR